MINIETLSKVSAALVERPDLKSKLEEFLATSLRPVPTRRHKVA